VVRRVVKYVLAMDGSARVEGGTEIAAAAASAAAIAAGFCG